MHTRILFINTLVAIGLLASPLAAQQDFSIGDLNPSRVQIDRNSDLQNVPAKSRFEQPQPDSSRPSSQSHATLPPIFQNDLRGSDDENQDQSLNKQLPNSQPSSSSFDRQPQPPQPRNGFGNSNQASPINSSPVNPLNELNPNRLMPRFERTNPDLHKPDQTIPRLNQLHPRSEPVIPASQLDSSRHSILTPEISDSYSQDSGAVVATNYGADTQTKRPGNQNIKSLLARYDVSSFQDLPGVPTSLRDMMQTTPVQLRMRMVQQYWETYFDWATLQNRKSFEGWLGQLPNPRSQPEQLLLQTAKSMSANETLAAEIQLSRSQSKLQQLSKSNREELLPLPLDQPLTGKYITHYEWYESRQMLPQKLKGINEMLPRTYQLLSQRAATVQQAENARNQARSAYASGQLGIASVLESGRSWMSTLQGLVGTTVSYNQAISDYALTIVPASKPVDQIVSMLVAKQKPVVAVAQRNSVLQQPQTQRTQPGRSINAAGPNAGPFKQSQQNSSGSSNFNQAQTSRSETQPAPRQFAPQSGNESNSPASLQPRQQFQGGAAQQPSRQPSLNQKQPPASQFNPSSRSSNGSGKLNSGGGAFGSSGG